MHFSKKVNQLSEIINEQLFAIINKNGEVKKCVYLGLPYYTNIGDVLIWQGTECFLKRIEMECLYRASPSTYSEKRIWKIINKRDNLSCEVLFFLQGGGNFGDLWEEQQNFRRKIINDFPNNPIIILPQTVFYDDTDKMKMDVELFAKHKKLIICARENKSYEVLKENFHNKIILVPDMAFCIPSNGLKKFQSKPKKRVLFLKRNDKELNDTVNYLEIISETKIDICDWPSMEKRKISSFFLWRFMWATSIVPNLFSKLTDIYAYYFFRYDMIKIGIKFLSEYKKIYTTRLHVAILCCLMEKPYLFFDNSYGKNKSFFETWLSDLDTAKFLR